VTSDTGGTGPRRVGAPSHLVAPSREKAAGLGRDMNVRDLSWQPIGDVSIDSALLALVDRWTTASPSAQEVASSRKEIIVDS
jgi:hypothetical protein